MERIKKYQLSIGYAIKYFRKEKDWSQEYLGFKAGLDRTYVGSIERGERNATLGSLDSISSALNITLYQLIRKAEEYDE